MNKFKTNFEKIVENYELTSVSIIGIKSKVKKYYNYKLTFTDNTTLILPELTEKLEDFVKNGICKYNLDEYEDLTYFKITEQ
jgi:hypothetical protein